MAERPPKLPHPATTPRLHKTGRQQRERPIWSNAGGEGMGQWEIEVTPLSGASSTGRGFDAPEQVKKGVLFEIRAAYYGPGLPEFGSQPNTRVVPTTHTEDHELAIAIARAFEERLRRGERELNMVAICQEVERRRG